MEAYPDNIALGLLSDVYHDSHALGCEHRGVLHVHNRHAPPLQHGVLLFGLREVSALLYALLQGNNLQHGHARHAPGREHGVLAGHWTFIPNMLRTDHEHGAMHWCD